MNPSDDVENDSRPVSSRFTTRLILLIMVLQIAVALVSYPFLPALVPSHWSITGQIDNYMPKLAMVIFMPALSIGLSFLILGLIRINPRRNGQGQRANLAVVSMIVVGYLLFMLVIQLTIIAAALRFPIDINFIVTMCMSALFILIGNYLGKLRPNMWAGIRTPWTLANDTVWERTHRLGGWLFVGVGLFGIITSFIPSIRLWGVIALLVVVVVWLTAYSYILYRRIGASSAPPLSRPSDGRGN